MASILVIDDEESLRDSLRRNLQKSGYHVVAVREGRQALQQLASTPVDLVLIDIFMPGKEGLETIRELHRSHPNIPMIAMSGGGVTRNADVLRAAKLLGARCTLHKPFTGEALLKVVQQELGNG